MAICNVEERARLYASRAGIAIADRPFDGGDDGAVWISADCDNAHPQSVVKAFFRPDNYFHELDCYKVLAGTRKINDFNVPHLIGSDDELLVIEIGMVTKPYILDFGKASLVDPQWDEIRIDQFNKRMKFWWGRAEGEVRLLLHALRRRGIWYYDAKPGNIVLDNFEPDLDDEEEY